MEPDLTSVPAGAPVADPEEDEEGSRKYTQAVQEKEEGNHLFKKGSVQEAVEIWRHALKLCYELSVSGTAPNAAAMGELQVVLENNIAAGLLKEGSYSRCIEHCEHVLHVQPGNEKALLRMAKAHAELQEYKKAEDAIRRLLKVHAENHEATRLYRQVLEAQVEHKRQQKALYQTMLGKGKNTDSLAVPPVEKQARAAEASSASPLCPWMWAAEFLPMDKDPVVWRAPHSIESLTEDCNFPLTRGLPLTILFALQAADEARRKAISPMAEGSRNGGANGGSCSRTPAAGAVSDSAGGCQRSDEALWDWRSIRKDVLCVHLIGATSAHEMGCKFTVLMERWPRVKTLILVLIGFLGQHGKLENKLERGKVQPPAVVKTEDGREQLAVPFKGTYEEFVQAVPGVLTNPECTFFPDFAVLSTPLFARDLDSWKPALSLLLDADVLSIVTVSGPLRDEPTAEIKEEEEVVRQQGGRVIVPTSKNDFPIIFRVPKEALKKRAELGAEGDKTDFIGNELLPGVDTADACTDSAVLGAKHAAFFVFRGRVKCPA
ncbi:putative TPR domain-containing protein [Neospora caninum Liverpool]|uniref:Putative TPR domain-containing protein n=1 Tax=Neospora caninum (strain Liverpool) TaxID=572307 RepID=F0VN73_NEOCL|nr:putative TPR domain-containing protein [Neospora caninum Liverpool]CBZ55169.1 putative TPR domain-containing protein [Neospora caninum Liverpool]CEL69896.1 TPA: TPR domain-containing protein, putative [Neospora caninum Liverpool]|eukprot:XP_003885197.1 putative TPR domain-containing protein [Neospora caninum Liverpool]